MLVVNSSRQRFNYPQYSLFYSENSIFLCHLSNRSLLASMLQAISCCNFRAITYFIGYFNIFTTLIVAIIFFPLLCPSEEDSPIGHCTCEAKDCEDCKIGEDNRRSFNEIQSEQILFRGRGISHCI